MLFNSPIFIFLFLPLILFFYYLIFRKFPNFILVIASLVFYWWGEPEFSYILLTIILVNYFFGLLIEKYLHHEIFSKLYLFLIISINLGFLIYYKYWFFLLYNILGQQNILKQESIPLAISFFTFHAISYNVDIFRKQASAQKNPLGLLLYFLFFPHLLAGPIVKYNLIVDQLKTRIILLDSFVYGIERFIFGLAKKVLIADRLSPVVNEIFSIQTNHMGTPVAWVGLVCFALQIYFDFSGYSDMAIGLARMFGFKFPENFNYPYISSSITEFWTRWHMTLYSFIKDYLYYPLVRSLGKSTRIKLYFCLFVTFILLGLWHGADWKYIAFGVIHGFFMVLERIKNGRIIDYMPKPFRNLYTLTVVFISWIVFRSENLNYAFSYLKTLFGWTKQEIIFQQTEYFLRPEIIFIILVGIICSTPIFSYLGRFEKNFNPWFKMIRLFGLCCLILLITIAVASQTYNPFLYFRF